MQRKHLVIALVAVVVLMILSTVGMDLLWTRVLDYGPVLEENWGVTLPKGAKCETLYGSDESVEGPRCHILTYKKAEYVEEMLPWGAATDEAAAAARTYMQALELSEEYWPDWSACRLWEDSKDNGDRIMIFWDEEQILLYVLEELN